MSLRPVHLWRLNASTMSFLCDGLHPLETSSANFASVVAASTRACARPISSGREPLRKRSKASLFTLDLSLGLSRSEAERASVEHRQNLASCDLRPFLQPAFQHALKVPEGQ